jgi:hypothetical protein
MGHLRVLRLSICSVKAPDCIIAQSTLERAIQERKLTGAILTEVVNKWKTTAPDSDKLMNYYMDDTPLEYTTTLLFQFSKVTKRISNIDLLLLVFRQISECNMIKI